MADGVKGIIVLDLSLPPSLKPSVALGLAQDCFYQWNVSPNRRLKCACLTRSPVPLPSTMR